MNREQAGQLIIRYARLLWERRLVSGSSGNVSVFVDDGTMLITPASRALRDLSAGELALTDASGKRLAGGIPSSELPLHVAAYRARPDIRALIHTHPTYCVVWSKTGNIFPLDTVGARESLGRIAWAAFAAPGSLQLAAGVAALLEAGNECVLMEAHGLAAAGPDLETAFLRTDQAEEAARTGFLSRLTLA